MKKSQTLPEVLSKSECKELFKAPKSFKHRFMPAFIRRYQNDFYSQCAVLDYHKRVLNVLENCRTATLGGQVEQCDACGEISKIEESKKYASKSALQRSDTEPPLIIESP